MITINEPEDTNTSNILKGFIIFLSVCPKTKIISHSGVIDVVLTNSTYSKEELSLLVSLGWEELTDYSWRYWLASDDLRCGEKKESPWITLAGKYENDEVLAHIRDYRKELDELEDTYYDQAYQIVEERMYDQ